MAVCLYCSLGIHLDCTNPEDLEADELMCCCHKDHTVLVEPSQPVEKPTEGYKQHEEIRDQLSTGRKRAAKIVMAEVPEEGMPCEWAHLKYAGGGAVPIVGCKGNLIFPRKGKDSVNIHHGPDKSTLNNERPGNLWAICAECHNRWHTLNDEFYGERPPHGKPFLPIDREVIPHDPDTPATFEEILQSEMWWATHKSIRPEYRSWENVTTA